MVDLSDLVEVVEQILPVETIHYIYESLEYERSVRLLALQPASSAEAPLRGDLREVRLSDKPEYEAISYTWGDPVLPKSLDLRTSSLKITDNLSLALRRFRLTNQIRYVWCDAVCINQSDNEEKAKQVSLMGDIYRSCQKVLIWLGPGDEHSGNIIGVLKQLSIQADRYGLEVASDGTIVGGWEGSAPPTDVAKEALENLAIEYNWIGADTFYSAPWFSRLWIVQEVALGPSAHLYYGAFDISWEEFMLAAHIEYRGVSRMTAMNLRMPAKFYLTKFLASTIRGVKHAQLDSKLLPLLGNFTFSHCSDSRDRVYALLSLRGTRDVEVMPDYNKTAVEVFIELAREMVQKNFADYRHIFHYAGVARRYRPQEEPDLNTNTVYDLGSMPALETVCKDVPSWVPDWRITGKYVSFHISLYVKGQYLAATQFTPKAIIDPRDWTLSVLAQGIDDIKFGKNLGLDRKLDYNAHREQVLLIKEFYDQHVNSFLVKPLSEDQALSNFARTIIADNTQAATRAYLRDPLSAAEATELWLQFASTPFNADSVSENYESDGPERGDPGTEGERGIRLKTYSRLFCYRTALKGLLNDRQFIFTDAGLIGLAPAIAQPGDLIAVFAGASTPLVLRPHPLQDDSGKIRHYIIGNCFVNGVMYGELFETLKKRSWQWATLK